MHLNKILDQIKHHPSPTEAIDKLGKALEKHEGSLLEKGFQILKSELCANVYEAINGPHFDEEHVEITGTFKKSTTYSLGKVVSVSKPYDEPLPPGQFPMPMQNRRKLVDLVISCDGEQKKLSVSEDKTMMTDSTIGLTIATDKTQIVDMVKQSYNDCKVKKESVLKYDEEMRRCEDILKLLNTTPDITTNVTKDFKELDELKAEVKELKQLLQNVTTVRPEVNEKVPQAEEKQIEI